jgi:glycosyltransferase involved in cell wall biosynthesis
MRIAVVYDAVYPYVAGGAERRYYEIGRRLVQRGHDVQFVGWQWWDGASDIRRPDGTRLHGVGRARPLHDASGRRTFAAAWDFARRVAPVIARIDADVVECASIPYAHALFAAPILRARGIPAIVSWHEYMGARWREYAPDRAWLAAAVERQTARSGDVRIAVSAFTSRRLPPGPRTVVVPNGVDIEAIARVRGEHSAHVVMVGRLVPHKRVDLLLETLRVLPGVTAGIIGDGPDRPRLEAMAGTLGVADRVTFYGRVEPDERVVALVKGATCLLVASAQEGFAMIALEAMAAAVPPVVVRSQHSAAAELIDDMRDGIVVDATPEAIAHAVGSLVEDRSLQLRLGAAAADTARNYDWDAVAVQFEGLAAGLAGSRAPRRRLRERRAA